MDKPTEYIKREDVLEKAINVRHSGGGLGEPVWFEYLYAVPSDDIAAIPAADVEPVVRATWKDGKCTNCDCFGFERFDGSNEYTIRCPNCGAHMERSGSGE